ncbi:MAG: serine/threonine protein kinase [Myxococcales bacterium]|nr:serine/threonine protein kinase [Myxococcales bacterium]
MHPPREGESDAPRERLALQPSLDRFALLDKIGEGGMGSVYAAFDRRLDRKVAIKLLRERSREDREQRARMLREAQAMARLSHPNVVPVFEVGEFDGQVFVAMEFIDGVTLQTWQASERSWSDIVEMYAQVGRGLAAAHDAGLVHRDFKPQNVLVGRDQRPRVIDFGLARRRDDRSLAVEAPALDATPEHGSLLESPLTRVGALVGTPAYMAPEQITGDELGPASDQFSFCVALYEALYGELPFARASLQELLDSVERAPAERPADAVAPLAVHEVVTRGLARAPEDRWPSMDALLAAITSVPDHDASVGRRARLLLIAVLLISFIVMWPVVVSIFGDVHEVSPADLVSISVLTSAPTFLVIGWYWARIKQTALTKALTSWVAILSVALLVHRLVAARLGTPVATTLTTDHLLLAAVAAAYARWVGRWAWLLVGGYLIGTLASLTWPDHAANSLTLALIFSLVVAGLHVRGRRAELAPRQGASAGGPG